MSPSRYLNEGPGYSDGAPGKHISYPPGLPSPEFDPRIRTPFKLTTLLALQTEIEGRV